MKRKTPMKSGGQLKRTGSLNTHKPLKAKSHWNQSSSLTASPTSNTKDKPKQKTMKRGSSMSGKGRSTADVTLHEEVRALGCFACNLIGLTTPFLTQVHHINGRNKGKAGDVCEQQVICLCMACHKPSVSIVDDSLRTTLNDWARSVHEHKSVFEALIGSEAWCVYETHKLLSRSPNWLTSSEWNEYLSIKDKELQEVFARDTIVIRMAA